jgi:hypothetical protein
MCELFSFKRFSTKKKNKFYNLQQCEKLGKFFLQLVQYQTTIKKQISTNKMLNFTTETID